jgi:flagellar biosynthesis protein FlgN
MPTDALNPDALKNLNEQLRQDIAASEALLALLLQERVCLTTRNFDALEALIDAKAQQLSRLHQGGLARESWIRQWCPGAAPEQLGSLLNRPGYAATATAWQTLKQQLQQCQDANRINGKLVQRGLSVHEHYLALLRGQMPGEMVYTDKGKAQGRAASGWRSEA